jgi:hypothetical protein
VVVYEACGAAHESLRMASRKTVPARTAALIRIWRAALRYRIDELYERALKERRNPPSVGAVVQQAVCSVSPADGIAACSEADFDLLTLGPVLTEKEIQLERLILLRHLDSDESLRATYRYALKRWLEIGYGKPQSGRRRIEPEYARLRDDLVKAYGLRIVESHLEITPDALRKQRAKSRSRSSQSQTR